jgi:lysophospholipid acyltransferase (LPLAT)-like uncharacterized protein
MKIRNPKLIAAAGWLGFQASRAVVSTLRLEMHSQGPVVYPYHKIPDDKRYIYALWHESMLVPILKFGRPELGALVSKHADGKLLQQVLRLARMTPVEGSTNRGGVLALRKIIGQQEIWKHLVITIDGPRGPRRVAQPGIIYCASRSGMEIVPTAISFEKAWRAKSWDRFAVPMPRSKVKFLFAPPMKIPEDIRSTELEEYRQELQRRMDTHTAWAEAWAETGKLSIPAETSSATREV